MGTKQSTLERHGYVLQKTTENAVVATKEDDTFLIKEIKLDRTSKNPALISEIDFLMKTSHPHIASLKNSFKDENQNVYYIVMDNCQGGNLAAKIRNMWSSPQESEVLSWIAEICVALRTIHEQGFLHKRLTPENVLLTEFGTVCLGGFGNIHENSTKTLMSTNSDQLGTINYLPPEVFTEGTYDDKSDIWSVGCILYELCTREPACKTTVEDLQAMLFKLRDVADSLERVHEGATISSLSGGVIGAVGGIASIVGLILAPFTFGASLVVTGVGVGVGAAGEFTAGASSITNMVNQSSGRNAVQSIIKEFQQKLNTVVCWQQEIGYSLEKIRGRCDLAGITGDDKRELNQDDLLKFGCIGTGKGLGGVAELVRAAQLKNVGKLAAQGARAIRVAEIATGVLSGLFLAVDVFFIATDAKEMHHIRQAKAARGREGTPSESVSKTDTSDSDLIKRKSDRSEAQDQSPPIRSEIMKFAHSIKQAADDLQENLDELRSINLFLLSLEELTEQWKW